MNKELSLRILMLLSALESWTYATKERLPEHMHGELQKIVDVLTSEVLA